MLLMTDVIMFSDCRDTLIVAIGNCLTSFFAGFVIFSFLGFLAKETGQTVEDVVQSGQNHTFSIQFNSLQRGDRPNVSLGPAKTGLNVNLRPVKTRPNVS